MNFNPASAALWIVPLLLAVVFHEWAHGYVAKRLGDDTASMLGRLTLNPLAHVDPIGTVALPALLAFSGSPFMFGWAKPVPVVFSRLRNPRRDMVLVAMAGPGMNLLLAVASAAGLAVLAPMAVSSGGTASGGLQVAEPLAIMCDRSLLLNVLLAVFNMLPIPPLDGGRVAVGLLPVGPANMLAEMEPYGFFIIIALLLTNTLGVVLGPLVYGIHGGILSLFL